MRSVEAIRKAIADIFARARRLDQRTISRVSVLGAIVLVALVVATYGIARSAAGNNSLLGTDLGGTPAPGFTLADQNGATVSLQGLRGHPVVLAFMYTHCPDVCPLTAEKMHLAAQQLGSQANVVEWVGISVDPSGDTPDAAKQFAATHGLTGRLHFLLGSREQLMPVWRSYFLVGDESNPQPNQVVDHTGAVYLIDKQGRERVYLDSDFDPTGQLVKDLRILLSS
jgi:protein SCO1/2